MSHGDYMNRTVPNPNCDPERVCEFCGIDLDDGNTHANGCANEGEGWPVGTRAEHEFRTGRKWENLTDEERERYGLKAAD